MASNPMQRQKRISFISGVLVTVLIAAVIIGLLLWQLIGMKKKEKEEQQNKAQVYVLSKDVSSGQVITTDLLTKITVNKTTIPSNAMSSVSTFSSYALQDANGNSVGTDADGLYVNENNQKVRINIDENGKYYRTINGQNVVVELSEVPLIAKVTMKKNTVITGELVAKSDEVSTDDAREQEYNMVTLPTQLEDGDFVDIRLRLPNGVDYIVASKKEVKIPDVNGVPSEDTMVVKMSEDEILTMSNAIVEAYIMKGSEIYAAKYTEPGAQEKSTPTYPISSEVMSLINSDSNIVEKAKNALYARYSVEQRNNVVNGQIQKNSEDANSNVEKGIEEQITRQKEMRKQYLETLNGVS